MMRVLRSIEGRLLALALAAMAVLWCAAAIAIWFGTRQELDELLDAHLSQAAALLVVQQLPGIDDDSHVDAPVLHKYAPRVAFQVFHEGRLVLHSVNAPSQPMMDGTRVDEGFRDVTLEGRRWRVFAARGSERDVTVYVGERIDSRTGLLRAVLRGAEAPLLVVLPLLGLSLWVVVRHGLAPLRRLGQVLAQRNAQDLSPVVLDAAPAEMQPMLAALNGLLARIGTLLEGERRFTADAAHELRTPIAAIRTQAQVALREGDPAARAHALQATLEGCDRVTRLVEQLLTLARLESGGAAALESVDLARLAREAVGELAPQAIAKEQEIGVYAPAATPVHGDATLLAVLLRNLIDNAIRYSPRGATIQVSAGLRGGLARFAVDDSGAALAEDELQRLGERFFRIAGTGESGSGLGLSIARRIAAAHGGQLQLAPSRACGGLQASVEFGDPVARYDDATGSRPNEHTQQNP